MLSTSGWFENEQEDSALELICNRWIGELLGDRWFRQDG